MYVLLKTKKYQKKNTRTVATQSYAKKKIILKRPMKRANKIKIFVFFIQERFDFKLSNQKLLQLMRLYNIIQLIDYRLET